jgi:hypothetical protein
LRYSSSRLVSLNHHFDIGNISDTGVCKAAFPEIRKELRSSTEFERENFCDMLHGPEIAEADPAGNV